MSKFFDKYPSYLEPLLKCIVNFAEKPLDHKRTISPVLLILNYVDDRFLPTQKFLKLINSINLPPRDGRSDTEYQPDLEIAVKPLMDKIIQEFDHYLAQ